MLARLKKGALPVRGIVNYQPNRIRLNEYF